MAAIEIKNASLKFNVEFVDRRMSLRRYLTTKFSPASIRRRIKSVGHDRREFWALKEINLTIQPGEIVALLGHNGAGKSTMLRMMAGIYVPDIGSVKLNGNVGTLLSLGAGFNQMLTGYENIIQDGIFLGLDRKFLNEHIDEIIEFADLGEFIHAPLHTYSTGMVARLGFSIAIHINPEIVLVDEVLQTGDAAFRNKSSNLLKNFADKGRTVVMASHSLPIVASLCTRALLLDHGTIVMDDKPDAVIKYYNEVAGTPQQGNQAAAKPSNPS